MNRFIVSRARETPVRWPVWWPVWWVWWPREMLVWWWWWFLGVMWRMRGFWFIPWEVPCRRSPPQIFALEFLLLIGPSTGPLISFFLFRATIGKQIRFDYLLTLYLQTPLRIREILFKLLELQKCIIHHSLVTSMGIKTERCGRSHHGSHNQGSKQEGLHL